MKLKQIELKSLIENVVDLRLKQSNSNDNKLIVGRNSVCRIRDLKCSRKLYEICFENEFVKITNLTTNQAKRLTNGQRLTGPGFDYRVSIVETVDEEEEEEEAGEEKEIKWWTNDDSKSVAICSYRATPSFGAKSDEIILCSFDFDSTLIATKSGKKFSQNDFDFKLLNETKLVKRIETLFKDEDEDEKVFAIFSNQMGISKGHQTLQSIQRKIEFVLKTFNLRNSFAFLALRDDINRKPRPGMFFEFQKLFRNRKINLKKSFYVGDAAGRTNRKADHSSADILFALNCGFQYFQVPEDFCEDSKLKMPTVHLALQIYKTNLPQFDPRTFASSSTLIIDEQTKETIESVDDLIENKLKSKIILFVGFSGSGKSFFYEKFLKPKNFSEVNGDNLRSSFVKCENEFKRLITKKKEEEESTDGIAITNTNLDLKTREKWLKICDNLIAIHFDFTLKQCLHQNLFRRLTSTNSVSDLILYTQNKHYQKPELTEGFKQLFRIQRLANYSNDDLFKMFLCEK